MIRTFLFDLDGTLVNTNDLILASFQYTLDRYFPGKYKKEDIVPYFGEPLEVTFKRFDSERAEELIDVYREHNRRFHDRLVTEYPLVRETLKQLSERGCQLAVVTSKRREMVNRGLRLTQIEDYFDAVVTIDDVSKPKPDPEPVETALRLIGADPNQTVMIGDSPTDIDAGKRAGTKTAGVAWSIKGLEPLAERHPDYLIDQMSDLLPLAEKSASEPPTV